MSVNDWLTAFLITQAIEAPICWWAARSLPTWQRATYALGASAITHPILWFCLPWDTVSYGHLVVAGESFVVIVEGLWGRLWGVPRPWLISLIANAASVILGGGVRWVLQQFGS